MKISIILLFLTIAAALFVSESKVIRLPENLREIFKVPAKKLTNICLIRDRDPQIKCYCDNVKPGAAARALCWIVGQLQRDDLIWENFMSQPNLEVVLITALTEPGLTHLPTDLIRNATKLRNLKIEFGYMKQLPSFAFANSNSLQQLAIGHMKLSVLQPHAFSHLISLANLTITDNQITEIKSSVFYDLPNLNRLKLSNNKITTLHPGCFKHLTKLTHLNLDSNSLSALSRDNFEGLTKIFRLKLKRNYLSYIEDLTFVDLGTLEELFLDDNHIKVISERGFSGLTRLKTLALTGNELTALSDNTFLELNNVNFIDLSNNELIEVKEETFKPILDKMRRSNFELNLQDNNLDCDCSLSWLKSLRNDTSSHSVQTSLDSLLCTTDAPIPNVPTPTQSIPEEVTRAKIIIQDDYDYEEQMNLEPSPLKHKVKQNSHHFVELLSIPTNLMPCKEKKVPSKSTMDLSITNKGNLNRQLSSFPVALSIANMIMKA